MPEFVPDQNRLSGKLVMLLADMPEFDGTPANGGSLSTPVMETEEAVISMVRGILGVGGRMVVCAPLPLAFLAGVVSGEFVPSAVERPVPQLSVSVIGGEADDAMAHLNEVGYIALDGRSPRTVVRENGKRADALVCVSDRFVDEVALFRDVNERDAPVFAFAATGGDRYADTGIAVVVADRAVEAEAPLPEVDVEDSDEPIAPLPPLALAAQWIVERIVEPRQG